MPVPTEKIVVGKCFVTATSQVRLVSKIEDGLVFYMTRNPSGPWSDVAHSVFCTGFAEQVEREVPCSCDTENNPVRD